MRLFFAVDIPHDIRQAAGEAASAMSTPKGMVKWTRPDNIHLTLKFLGEAPSDKLEAIITAARKVASAYKGMEVEVCGMGVFPDNRKPRIIWLGTKGETDRLGQLADELDEAMAQVEFEREKRPFSPHLTIGRVRDPKAGKMIGGALAKHQQTVFGSFHVEKFNLYESQLAPQGPIYTVVSQFWLGAE